VSLPTWAPTHVQQLRQTHPTENTNIRAQRKRGRGGHRLSVSFVSSVIEIYRFLSRRSMHTLIKENKLHVVLFNSIPTSTHLLFGNRMGNLGFDCRAQWIFDSSYDSMQRLEQ